MVDEEGRGESPAEVQQQPDSTNQEQPTGAQSVSGALKPDQKLAVGDVFSTVIMTAARELKLILMRKLQGDVPEILAEAVLSIPLGQPFAPAMLGLAKSVGEWIPPAVTGIEQQLAAQAAAAVAQQQAASPSGIVRAPAHLAEAIRRNGPELEAAAAGKKGHLTIAKS